MIAAGPEPATGTGRVHLSFTVEDKEAPPTQRAVRVPPGVSVFDSASWNGIAIDSTCGGHGTCRKCRVQVTPATPVTVHDERTFNADQLGQGWRLACLVRATRDHDVVVPPLVTVVGPWGRFGLTWLRIMSSDGTVVPDPSAS